MLRKSRIFVVIFFIISVIIFAFYHFVTATITDRTMPVIEMDSESIKVPVGGGDAAILNGVTASDAKDGDITENLFIESRTAFLEKNSFNVTIAVADSDNHVSKVTRKVIYSNYRSPRFSLAGPLKFQTAREVQDDLNIAKSISANDVIDGNISNRIKISSDYSINIYNPGDYHMEFSVTNSMGDMVKLPVTVTLYSASQENNLPQLTLKNYLTYTPVDSEIDLTALIDKIEYRNTVYLQGEDGYLYNGEYDSQGGAVRLSSDAIKIDADIDWKTPGVYEVTFTYTDEYTEASNYARCYIVVY